jgi:hypothetical protein
MKDHSLRLSELKMRILWIAATTVTEIHFISVTVVAAIHKILIFSSDNLKEWSFISEFGPYNALLPQR